MSRGGPPAFIVKRREIGASPPGANPYRPHGQVTHGPWRGVAYLATEELARAWLAEHGRGLYSYAIFHRGKRLP